MVCRNLKVCSQDLNFLKLDNNLTISTDKPLVSGEFGINYRNFRKEALRARHALNVLTTAFSILFAAGRV